MRKIQNKSELHQSCDFEFNVCPFCNLGYKFCLLFLSSAVFFPNVLSETPSESQTVSVQISRAGSGCTLFAFLGYQQMTLDTKVLKTLPNVNL